MTDLKGDNTQHLKHARQLIGHAFPSVDIVLCTREQVEEAYAGKSPFLLSALEYGITLYNRRWKDETQKSVLRPQISDRWRLKGN